AVRPSLHDAERAGPDRALRGGGAAAHPAGVRGDPALHRGALRPLRRARDGGREAGPPLGLEPVLAVRPARDVRGLRVLVLQPDVPPLRRHPGDLPVLVGAHRQHAGRDRDGHLLLAHAPGTPALARGGPVGRGTAQVTGAHPLAAAFVAAALLLPPAPLPAQVAPPATGGAAALARQLA